MLRPLFLSLMIWAVAAPALAADLKEELGKVSAAYIQNFNKKDAAGITSLFTKDYLRVTADGVIADNTKLYEGIFKTGFDRLESKITEAQPLSDNMALVTGEANITGKTEKGDPLDVNIIWTALEVREGGQWKIRMLTSLPKPPPAPATTASK